MSSIGKKLRSEARKEAKKYAQGYREQFLQRLKVFDECLRPKPRLMPRFFYRWWANQVVDLQKLEDVINGKTQTEKKNDI